MTNHLPRKGEMALGFQDVFKALSDPTRREILILLRDGEMTAGEIVERFDTTGATISHHLSILKNADLVEDQRHGKYISYRLNTSVVEDILLWLNELRGEGDA